MKPLHSLPLSLRWKRTAKYTVIASAGTLRLAVAVLRPFCWELQYCLPIHYPMWKYCKDCPMVSGKRTHFIEHTPHSSCLCSHSKNTLQKKNTLHRTPHSSCLCSHSKCVLRKGHFYIYTYICLIMKIRSLYIHM